MYSVFSFSITEVGGAVTALNVGKDDEDSEKKDEMDDDIMFTALGEDDKAKPSVAPRWVTRVFAADCLCRIILLCENADKTHFDLASARTAKAKNPKGTQYKLPGHWHSLDTWGGIDLMLETFVSSSPYFLILLLWVSGTFNLYCRSSECYWVCWFYVIREHGVSGGVRIIHPDETEEASVYANFS